MRRIVIVIIAVALLVVARTGGRGIASRAFPGDGAYLTAPPSPVYNNLRALTVSAWIKPTGATPIYSNIVLIKSPVNFEMNPVLRYNPNVPVVRFPLNSFGFMLLDERLDDATAESDSTSGTIAPNGWVHIAATYNYATGGQPILYVNGILTPTDSVDNGYSLLPGANSADDSAGGWFIGDDTFGHSFIGEMADIRIFNTVLSQAQIESITFGGQPASGNLVAWWKLDSSAPYLDSSGHGNNLTEGNSFGIGNTSPGTDAPPIARWSGL